MPPLLPEYLPQTVQVVIQSTPVDWWTIGGTMVGAALGAGIGAYGAYKSAVKAGVDLQRRDKLEQALNLTEEISRTWGSVFARVSACISSKDYADANCIVKREIDSLDYELCRRLNILVTLYFNNEATERSNSLSLNVYMVWSHLSDIDKERHDYNWISEGASLRAYCKDYNNDSERLRAMLLSELSLKR